MKESLQKRRHTVVEQNEVAAIKLQKPFFRLAPIFWTSSDKASVPACCSAGADSPSLLCAGISLIKSLLPDLEDVLLLDSNASKNI